MGQNFPDDHSDGVMDLTSHPSPLWAYAFAPVNGAVTLTGYFTDMYGIQQTPIQTYTINAATTLTALYNAANTKTGPLSTTFVGFNAYFTGSVYDGRSGNLDGTINTTTAANPGAGCPQWAAGNAQLGRIA